MLSSLLSRFRSRRSPEPVDEPDDRLLIALFNEARSEADQAYALGLARYRS